MGSVRGNSLIIQMENFMPTYVRNPADGKVFQEKLGSF